MTSNSINISIDDDTEDDDDDDENSPYHSRSFNFANFVYTMNNDIILDEPIRQGFATVFLDIIDASAAAYASTEEKSSTKKRKAPASRKKNTISDASSSIPVYIDFTDKIPQYHHYKAIQTQKWKANRLKIIAKHYK